MWLAAPEDGFAFETEGEADFTGSLLLVATPTLGGVGLLAAKYLEEALGMEEAGGVYSPRFSPAAVVRERVPAPPARLLLGERSCGPSSECRAFAELVMEPQVPEGAVYAFGVAVLEWARAVGVRYVATMEGIARRNGASGERAVAGVATSERARGFLENAGVDLRPEVLVEGLSGVLLSEGARRGMHVFCLLPEVERSHDPLAAARALDVVDRFLVDVEVDVGPLMEEAARLEEAARERARPEELLMYS